MFIACGFLRDAYKRWPSDKTKQNTSTHVNNCLVFTLPLPRSVCCGCSQSWDIHQWCETFFKFHLSHSQWIFNRTGKCLSAVTYWYGFSSIRFCYLNGKCDTQQPVAAKEMRHSSHYAAIRTWKQTKNNHRVKLAHRIQYSSVYICIFVHVDSSIQAY